VSALSCCSPPANEKGRSHVSSVNYGHEGKGRTLMSLTRTDTSLLIELRTSLEAQTLVWALVQADYSLNRRPLPAKITDLHHGERRHYEDVALMALLLMNRDAAVYAESRATDVAFPELEQFVKDHDLDWLDDDNPINEGDAFEMLARRIGRKVLQRYRQLLNGQWPGMSRYLSELESSR
jgi:hypothetical protein